MYFAAKHIALAFDLPFGFEINGIDWVFLGAFLVIVLLFSSVVAELPLLKIVRHLLTSVKDGRAI
ncbi:hypothetical protein D1821_18450 (plasmid) [Phaeobacter inhibens]|nr:hypothetical protein D1821_18450 [Phaeobacter inhibens]